MIIDKINNIVKSKSLDTQTVQASLRTYTPSLFAISFAKAFTTCPTLFAPMLFSLTPWDGLTVMQRQLICL